MRSPVEENSALQHDLLEPDLTIMRCPDTGGVWIRPAAYWKWREKQSPARESITDDGRDLPISDSAAGKRCPEDGYFLIRHRVGHELNFHVDRCGHCGGIWLDANEWAALRRAELHDDLHMIFTSAWQAEVRAQQRRDTTTRLLREKIGDEDLRRIREVRNWIESHHRRHELLAYLRGEWDK